MSETLKSLPARQADRQSLKLTEYRLKLSTNVAAKLMPLYRSTLLARQSSCLHGLDSIAGTPIVLMRRRRANPKQTRTKQLVIQEVDRELSSWQFDNIDILAKLHAQFSALGLYFSKVSLTESAKPPARHLDVFTRLYQQTPARYKVNQKASLRPISLAKSTSKVSQLKRFFTPSDPSQAALPRSERKHLVLSSKIKSLCKQLMDRDPNFVTKMASPAVIDGTAKNGRQTTVKRQLFN